MSAEETLLRVLQARANHPACDTHGDNDPVSCGWKRVVLDIDAALKAKNRAELVLEAELGNRLIQADDHRRLLLAPKEASGAGSD